MTFRDFLEDESNCENREILNNAFENFKDGWNTIIPNVLGLMELRVQEYSYAQFYSI